jgi:hypothetical protein
MAKKAKSSKRPAKKAARTTASKSAGAPSTALRYAHPFFTTTPIANRTVNPKTGTTSLSQFAAKKLGPIPAPKRNAIMPLQDIIGQPGVDEIQNAGAIRLHVIGDAGRSGGDGVPQEQVAQAMTADYDPAAHGNNPALLLHLGDVIYGHQKAALYRDEFYRPYMKYPGKIIAIPGNHDGETFAGTDPVPLKEFLNNFCATTAAVPPIAGNVRIFRETMTQPGVYWMLSAPFVNVIGLYSNIAEGPGNLLGANGDDQQIKWLTKTLAGLKQSAEKKALVIATHHPPSVREAIVGARTCWPRSTKPALTRASRRTRCWRGMRITISATPGPRKSAVPGTYKFHISWRDAADTRRQPSRPQPSNIWGTPSLKNR